MTDNTNYTYKPAGEAIGRIETFEPKPNIVFQMGDSTEVMRLTKDGVWVNPDIKPEEAAQAVLSAIDAQIKQMVQRAVEEEREWVGLTDAEIEKLDCIPNVPGIQFGDVVKFARAIEAKLKEKNHG